LRRPLEVVLRDVARDDGQVGQALLLGFAVDVDLLGARVGEAGDLRVGEDLGEVEGEGTPAAAMGRIGISTDLFISLFFPEANNGGTVI
jgi:hypothetical protein